MTQPVDDAYWLGVAYADVWVGGGDFISNRLRLEKTPKRTKKLSSGLEVMHPQTDQEL